MTMKQNESNIRYQMLPIPVWHPGMSCVRFAYSWGICSEGTLNKLRRYHPRGCVSSPFALDPVFSYRLNRAAQMPAWVVLSPSPWQKLWIGCRKHRLPNRLLYKCAQQGFCFRREI